MVGNRLFKRANRFEAARFAMPRFHRRDVAAAMYSGRWMRWMWSTIGCLHSAFRKLGREKNLPSWRQVHVLDVSFQGTLLMQ